MKLAVILLLAAQLLAVAQAEDAPARNLRSADGEEHMWKAAQMEASQVRYRDISTQQKPVVKKGVSVKVITRTIPVRVIATPPTIGGQTAMEAQSANEVEQAWSNYKAKQAKPSAIARKPRNDAVMETQGDGDVEDAWASYTAENDGDDDGDANDAAMMEALYADEAQQTKADLAKCSQISKARRARLNKSKRSRLNKSKRSRAGKSKRARVNKPRTPMPTAIPAAPPSTGGVPTMMETQGDGDVDDAWASYNAIEDDGDDEDTNAAAMMEALFADEVEQTKADVAKCMQIKKAKRSRLNKSKRSRLNKSKRSRARKSKRSRVNKAKTVVAPAAPTAASPVQPSTGSVPTMMETQAEGDVDAAWASVDAEDNEDEDANDMAMMEAQAEGDAEDAWASYNAAVDNQGDDDEDDATDAAMEALYAEEAAQFKFQRPKRMPKKPTDTKY